MVACCLRELVGTEGAETCAAPLTATTASCTVVRGPLRSRGGSVRIAPALFVGVTQGSTAVATTKRLVPRRPRGNALPACVEAPGVGTPPTVVAQPPLATVRARMTVPAIRCIARASKSACRSAPTHRARTGRRRLVPLFASEQEFTRASISLQGR